MERVNKYGWVWYLGLGLLWLMVGYSQLFNPTVLLEQDAQRITGMSLSELEALNPAATKLIL